MVLQGGRFSVVFAEHTWAHFNVSDPFNPITTGQWISSFHTGKLMLTELRDFSKMILHQKQKNTQTARSFPSVTENAPDNSNQSDICQDRGEYRVHASTHV